MSTAVIIHVSPTQVADVVKNTVDALVATPPAMIDRKWFIGCLTQAAGVMDTLDRVVVALAKSKKTDDHSKIAARIQTILQDVPVAKGYKVADRIDEVWDQQHKTFLALTPEALAAYNALTREELAEHSF